ncbi:MAG TPA: response regulator [Bryobacteraceae bacterium]|jgi:CheY-like chemotaxis protein|nr:response regulator [Bryobacteraceae bacterium]HWB95388.1 response regulator [Bryobacteraceae bacterium]
MPDAERKRTILVVDDEPDVRRLVAATVNRFGYDALTADSGEHALALFKKHQDSIGLLLTDVVAPGMSGPMLADKLLELEPGLKVLYMSGYDRTQVVRRYVVEKGHALIAKPFTLDQLGSKIAELLGIPAPVRP